jgi:hypothetical protein
MAIVETRPDGVEVLIRGDTKKEKDEVVRGLLDVAARRVWKAVSKEGMPGLDGKRASE